MEGWLVLLIILRFSSKSFLNRPNLKYSVIVVDKGTKKEQTFDRIAHLIQDKFEQKCGIICCLSREDCKTSYYLWIIGYLWIIKKDNLESCTNILLSIRLPKKADFFLNKSWDNFPTSCAILKKPNRQELRSAKVNEKASFWLTVRKI